MVYVQKVANANTGLHKTSIAYTSAGQRRYNQPFNGTSYGPEFVHGDVIGVGYRPRIGTIFFTRNGKKLDDVTHGLKAQNFFPTIGANGPCTVHVNFGQLGFVFIEANVKKWGLAPATGSLAPPPPYGSEQGSILLEAGDGSMHTNQSYLPTVRQGRAGSRFGRMAGVAITSPGPVRSATDISLAQLAHIPSNEDVGEGSSSAQIVDSPVQNIPPKQVVHVGELPPEYTSPQHSPRESQGEDDVEDDNSGDESRPMLRRQERSPPVPSYDDAVGQGASLGVR